MCGGVLGRALCSAFACEERPGLTRNGEKKVCAMWACKVFLQRYHSLCALTYLIKVLYLGVWSSPTSHR